MAEYIERGAAVKIAEKYGLANGSALGRHTGLADCIASEIADIPAADVAPVVHGRWEDSTDEWLGTDVYTCSKCRESYVLVEGTPKENLWHYCPNCGAQMHEDDFCSYGECREDKDEK